MLDFLADPSTWVALLTLTVLEIVLGVDNVVFLSVLVSRLPDEMARRARQIGLALALGFRIVALLVLSWLIGLTQPVVTILGHDISWKDLVLLAGGLFLIYKATREMHDAVEEGGERPPAAISKGSFVSVIIQIVLIDVVFSIDSIVTAIGMAQSVEVMIAAVVIAVGIMYLASGTVAGFIARHPTTKMLALAFLLLIGLTLATDGLGFHIDKGYIYAAMAFATAVEAVNILTSQNRAKAKAAEELQVVAAEAGPQGAGGTPRRKSGAAARAQSRPKSAPRKKVKR